MGTAIGERLNQLPIGKTHKRATALIGVGLFFEFFEVFLAGVLASVLEEKFHIHSSIMPLLLGSSFLGMFFGALFLSRAADRYGRKIVFIVNLTIYSLSSLLIAISPNVSFVILFRFIAGFGLGAQPALCDTYLSELIPAGKRGKFIAWAYTLSFLAIPIEGFLARTLVPLAPLGIDGWRWMFVIGAIGSIVVFAGARHLPESPLWLASKGRLHEAEEIIQQLGEKRKVGHVPGMIIHQQESYEKLPFSALFKKPFLTSTVMLYIFQIFQTIGYYGFGTLAPIVLASKGYTITHSLEYVALSFIGYPLGSLLSVPLIDRIDRKWLVVLSAFFMGVFGLMFGVADSSSLIVIAGFIYTIVSNIFSNAYHTLQAEIFPTAVRATASGGAYSISRLMSGLMPFVLLPVLERSGATVMFTIVAAAMIIVILDVAILAPRTTGQSLDRLDRPDQLPIPKSSDISQI
ncbi:MFS transporter [Fictibacillus sp. Mic-4]|uniref:MFS transporter n=1 Tax=Fictibacillus sp. Mic-4 TaxID=3132826 RepID=UPI003CF9B87D